MITPENLLEENPTSDLNVVSQNEPEVAVVQPEVVAVEPEVVAVEPEVVAVVQPEVVEVVEVVQPEVVQSEVAAVVQPAVVQPTVVQPAVVQQSKIDFEAYTLEDFYKKNNVLKFEGHSQNNLEQSKFLRNLVKNKKKLNVMEIGFNAGHSAELFLSSNKNLKLLSFDLGEHDYLKLGKKFIDNKYPGRHKLILGDSLVTVPKYIKENSNTKFDIIFVDGGHFKNVPFNDMKNCMNLAHKDTIVILDDVKKTNIKCWNKKPNEVWELFKAKKYVTEIGQKDFSPTHGLAYGKYNLCEIYIISLLKQERKKKY